MNSNKEKIVLVNPPLSLEERYGLLSGSGTTMPPWGLALLAAIIRKEKPILQY